uniref:hypothetical protein n=2 Tax=Vibrio TaxID=662 RepID=UPI000AC34645
SHLNAALALISLKVDMSKKVLEINYLHNLCEQIKIESDPVKIREKLAYILEFYDVINYNYSYSSAIWRGRLCNDQAGYSNISEVGYPPKEFTPANRLNEPNAPLLYSSINQYAILDEIGATEGSYVHMLAYTSLKDAPLRMGIIGDIAHTHRWGNSMSSDYVGEQLRRIMGEMSPEVGRSYVYTDAFLSSILQDPKASETNYLHSRILASLLFEKQNNLDGIVYPSVALDRSMNFAIKPSSVDQKLEKSATFVVKVKKKFNYGIYDMEIVRGADGHQFNGDIVWRNEC